MWSVGSVGGAVAVVLIGVVVAAFGAEEERGEHEQAAATDQHGGEGETRSSRFQGLRLRVSPVCVVWAVLVVVIPSSTRGWWRDSASNLA